MTEMLGYASIAVSLLLALFCIIGLIASFIIGAKSEDQAKVLLGIASFTLLAFIVSYALDVLRIIQ